MLRITQVENYPDYLVREDGTVFSFKRATFGSPMALKPQINTKGYLVVRLYNSEGGKTLRVHKLVANAFLPNQDNKPQVNHIDANKENNSVSNLEWCDNQYNCEHALAKHYKLRHKSGETVEIFNMNKWCAENGLQSSSMSRMLHGGRKTYAGWSNAS